MLIPRLAEQRPRDGRARTAVGTWWAPVDGDATWSPSLFEMLGLDVDRVEPSATELRSRVHPDDRGVWDDALAFLDAGQGPVDLGHRLLLPDGRVKIVWSVVTALSAPDGRVIGRHGTVRDVTALGRTGVTAGAEQSTEAIEERVRDRTAELAATLDAVRAASEAKSAFLANVSHEVRTPLNVVLGYAQLLLMDDGVSEDGRASLAIIRDASEQLLALANGLLDLARIELAQFDLDPVPVDVDTAVERCLGQLAPAMSQRDLCVSYDPEPPGLEVMAEPLRLAQVLGNLLSNATKYNIEGGSVRVRSAPDGAGGIRIEVADTGPGFDIARIDEAFEPFNRLGQEHTEVDGTGMGLAICHRLVEAMGGRIEVDSAPGEGSTFALVLRAAPPGAR